MSQKYASKNKINLMTLKSSLFYTRGIHFFFFFFPQPCALEEITCGPPSSARADGAGRKHVGRGRREVPPPRGIHFKFLMIPRTQHTLIFLLPHELFLSRSLQFSFKKIFIWLCQVLVAASKLLITARGIQFPDKGLKLGPLHAECGVLATGP